LLGAKSAHVRYSGTFIGAMGIYPAVANTISWAANNIEGMSKHSLLVLENICSIQSLSESE
jgi:hypothetical protein